MSGIGIAVEPGILRAGVAFFRLWNSRWNMFLVFGAGLIIGGIGGMLSWLAAAAYLESRRSRYREMGSRPDQAKFAADSDFAVCVEAGGDWAPRIGRSRRRDRGATPAGKVARAGTQRPSTI
jgi:hypothetical protein